MTQKVKSQVAGDEMKSGRGQVWSSLQMPYAFDKEEARQSVEEELVGWSLWGRKSHLRHFIPVKSCSAEARESTEDSKPESAMISPLRLCTVTEASSHLSFMDRRDERVRGYQLWQAFTRIAGGRGGLEWRREDKSKKCDIFSRYKGQRTRFVDKVKVKEQVLKKQL